MIDLRTRDAAELAKQLVALGQEPDRDGSFMTTVHRTVIKVRSLFTDLDTTILPGLIDGEERILAYYNEALSEARDAPWQAALVSQRQRLQQKVEQMRALARTSES